MYRELQAAKFDLMRQKHINDDLELEIREISSRAEKRDSSAESMQQHLSQMRDRLDELQHFESTCHMYEQQVQKLVFAHCIHVSVCLVCLSVFVWLIELVMFTSEVSSNQ